MSTWKIKSFSSSLGEQASALAERIQSYLAGQQAQVRDLTAFRKQDTRTSDKIIVRLLLEDGLVSPGYKVVVFEASAAAPFEFVAQEYWTQNPNEVLVQQTDCSSASIRESGGITLLVITASAQRLLTNGVFFAQPEADIGAGLLGACTIFDADGNNIGTASVLNRSTSNTWSAGTRAVVTYAVGQATLVGLPAI